MSTRSCSISGPTRTPPPWCSMAASPIARRRSGRAAQPSGSGCTSMTEPPPAPTGRPRSRTPRGRRPGACSGGRSGDELILIYTGGTTGMPRGVMWRQHDLFLAVQHHGRPARAPISAMCARRLGAATPPVGLPAPPLMHGTELRVRRDQSQPRRHGRYADLARLRSDRAARHHHGPAGHRLCASSAMRSAARSSTRWTASRTAGILDPALRLLLGHDVERARPRRACWPTLRTCS